MGMASRKTWVWILVGTAGVGLVGLIVVAGAGVYFVTRHISTEKSTSAEAIRAFDAVRASFPNQKPLYDLDNAERPRVARPLNKIPTSQSKPDHLWVLAWDPDDERLVKVSLPFWVLRLGKRKMEIIGKDGGFDLERLNLDGEELERIGPALIFDFRDRDGVRVLLWTQ
jgi:hypothetical protein